MLRRPACPARNLKLAVHSVGSSFASSSSKLRLVQAGGGGGGPPRGSRPVQQSGGRPPRRLPAAPWLITIVGALIALCRTCHSALKYERWLRHQVSGAALPSVTIVVPVLNEEETLPSLLRHLSALDPPPAEVVFVDGGSTDRTCDLIRQHGHCRLLRRKRGRARQLNAGARAAKSELLCFLHADSRCCQDVVNVVRHELADAGCAAGAFATRITHAGATLWPMTLHLFVKAYYTPLLLVPRAFFLGFRTVLGDQTIFTRARDWKDVGGFNEELAIFEDADLIFRLHHHGTYLRPGKRAAVRQVLYRGNETDGRRFAAWGPLWSTYLHFRLSYMWWFGCRPEELRRVYEDVYTDAIR